VTLGECYHERVDLDFVQHPFLPDMAFSHCIFKRGMVITHRNSHAGIGHVLFSPNQVVLTHNYFICAEAEP
jgi:hypothetical protein